MSTIIKQLVNNRQVIFDRGKFDDWCVFVVEKNGSRRAPFDEEYFTDLKNISGHYEIDKIYDDFVEIYNKTSKVIDQDVLSLIDGLVSTYREEHQALVEQWFVVIYAGMIAEENKKLAVLKKRIKRLGMHQILKLGYEPKIAANFSRRKKWTELDGIMKPLGF